ncbi:MAG: transglycosylase SLT domain-containing protein [Cyclobacteriaceae bacterium]
MRLLWYQYLILSLLLGCFCVSCTSSSNTADDNSLGDSDGRGDLIVSNPGVESVSYEGPPPHDPQDEIIGLGKPMFGDLDSMIARRRIRALVPYNHTYYFIDGSERRGLAYEALNMFEEALNKELGTISGTPRVRIIFIPTSHDRIIPLLKNGYGDLAVSGLTVTDDRKDIIDFSFPTISGINEILISGPKSPIVKSRADLAGQRVFVHPTSSFRQGLESLSDSLVRAGKEPIKIEPLAEYLETEDALQMVSAGIIPFTVVEEYIAGHWSEVLDSLKVHPEIAINSNASYAWAFRQNSPQFAQKVNEFIRENRKGTLMGNILFNRYLKNDKYLKNALSPPAIQRLVDIQGLFVKYADMYQFDWLLLAALAYQESGLNQNAKSHAGAVGIMQIKPKTAAGNPINIQGVDKVENNIHAGTKYLRFLIDRYYKSDSIDVLNQGLFALAAYNAGPARINRLRKKAERKGLNPNHWFDSVEMVVANDIGRETVHYVSNIYKYFTSYRSLRGYAQASGKSIIESN